MCQLQLRAIRRSAANNAASERCRPGIMTIYGAAAMMSVVYQNASNICSDTINADASMEASFSANIILRPSPAARAPFATGAGKSMRGNGR